MFSYLRGTALRGKIGSITLDVQGVGYHIECPVPVWELVEDSKEYVLHVSPYIREDRFDLFGFINPSDKTLFRLFIEQPGIGPKLGLELLGVPKSLFLQAISTNDASILTSIKGIGKKTAEKLLVELKSIYEKQPGSLQAHANDAIAQIDPDALAALENLGYDTKTAIQMLTQLPTSISTTEARIEAALKSM